MPPPDCPSIGMPAFRHLIEAKERCGGSRGEGGPLCYGRCNRSRLDTYTKMSFGAGSKLKRTVALSQVHEPEAGRMGIILHAFTRNCAASALHSMVKGRPRAAAVKRRFQSSHIVYRLHWRTVLHPTVPGNFHMPPMRLLVERWKSKTQTRASLGQSQCASSYFSGGMSGCLKPARCQLSTVSLSIRACRQ